MNSQCKHLVPELKEKARFSDYVRANFQVLPSSKSIKKAIKSGYFKLNGRIAQTGLWVEEGELIEFLPPKESNERVFQTELQILYEDQYLAVIDKPAGLPVNGHYFRTVENALPFNLSLNSSEAVFFKPRPVHRLDSQTSGLLLVSKEHQAHIDLSRQFEQGVIKKEYLTIVQGLVNEGGEIDLPIEGRPAISRFAPLKNVPSLKNGHLSLLKLIPITGRTHQLRIHLARMGHPIVGDLLHGERGNTFRGKGLFLSAVSLSFNHPMTNEKITVEREMPDKFNSLLEREARRWDKYNGKEEDSKKFFQK